MTFNINANGTKEVNSSGVPVGDTDGFATGTLTLDDGTGGSTGFAVFNLTYGNLAVPFSAHHIHQAPPTTTGGIFLYFNSSSSTSPEPLRTGDATSGTIQGTVTGMNSTAIDAIFANPGAFYYNLHNGPFPGGAVRDQLTPVPEPSTIALGVVATAMAAVLMRRRSQKKA